MQISELQSSFAGRRGRIATVTAWMAAGMLAAGTASAASTYRVTELAFTGPPDDPFNSAVAVAVNQSNTAAVSWGGSYGTSAQRCTQASCQVVTPLYIPHWPVAWSNGINDAGMLLATSADIADSTHSVLFDGSSNVKINGFPDDYCGGCDNDSYAEGLNNAGQVVGSARGVDGRQRGFIWKDGVITELPTLGGSVSIATAINDVGEVVGQAQTAAGDSHAFLYRQNKMRDLGTLASGKWSVAKAVNRSRYVVGCATTVADGSRTRAFRYVNGKMTGLPTLGGKFACAYGINDAGQIVGDAENAAGQLRGFLHDTAGVHDLNDLLRPADRAIWTIVSAGGINKNGVIAVTGQKAGSSVTRALLLRPGN